MMLPNQGPTSSLMEDLADLGLAEEKGDPKAKDNKKGDGYAEPDAKGGDYAGPPGKAVSPDTQDDAAYNVNVGDVAGGDRHETHVRSDGKFDKEAKAEDEEHDEETVVESNKMVPSFMIPTETEVQEAAQQEAEQLEEDQLTKAWQVVHAYFSEDNDGLNDEGLRGVINAMGFALNTCVEDIANLTVENTRLTEAVNELTGLLYENQEEMPDQDDEEKDDEEKDDDEDEDEGEERPKKLPPWMQKESRQTRANLTEDASLNSLLDEIRGIGVEESKPTKVFDLQAKLIEGYESVQESCNDIVGRIIQVVADDQGIAEGEEPELSEEDERVQLAQFFYGIAEDAEIYLSRLTEGDVPFKVAEADLAKIYADMEKGIEAMHTVE